MDNENKQATQNEKVDDNTSNVVVDGKTNLNTVPTQLTEAIGTEPELPASSITSANDKSLTWSGPEFIAYDKATTWYLYLFMICIALSAIAIFLLKDLITTVVIIVAFLVIGVYGTRKPKEVSYYIDNKGVQIAEKVYLFNDFKNFSLIQEDKFSNVIFIPLKRFAVSVSIYFPRQTEQAVLDIISNHLPYEQHKPDLLDRLLTRIRY